MNEGSERRNSKPLLESTKVQPDKQLNYQRTKKGEPSEKIWRENLLKSFKILDPKIFDEPKEKFTLEELEILFASPKSGDVTLLIEGKPLHAHKKILSESSDYFVAMFTRFQESTMDTIVLNNVKFSVFKILLQFLYTKSIRSPSTFEAALSVLLIADQFCFIRLKNLIQEILIHMLESDKSKIAFVSSAAEECSAEVLLKFCQEMAVDSKQIKNKKKKHLKNWEVRCYQQSTHQTMHNAM